MTDASGTTPNTSQGATAPASKGKKAKSSTGKKPKSASSHPKFSVMIKQAITNIKARNGASKAAILKYILANFKVNSATANQHLKSALRAGTKKNIKTNKRYWCKWKF